MQTLAASTSDSQPLLLDRLAIGLSGLCAIHCLTTAIALSLLSSVVGWLHAPIIHEAGLVIAMILAALALGQGVRRHRRRLPVALGALGIALMAAALSLPHGWSGELAFTLVGVLLLAIAHQLNRRAHR